MDLESNLVVNDLNLSYLSAIKTQIWTAVSAYVLISIIRKRLEIKASLYTILQILGVTLFEKTPLSQVLTERNYNNEQTQNCNQLSFNDF